MWYFSGSRHVLGEGRNSRSPSTSFLPFLGRIILLTLERLKVSTCTLNTCTRKSLPGCLCFRAQTSPLV